MKRFTTTFILSFIFYVLSAQLSDKLWLGGYDEFPGVPGYGQFILKFSGNTSQVQQLPLAFNFESTEAVAATPDGQLLFYSNGCEVANRLHEVMPNGQGLNPGGLSDQVCPWKGYIVPQGATALPMPGDSTRFYLIHMGAVYEPQRKLRLGPLYYSIIDMTQQNGLGDVASKNNVLLEGDLGNFTAVRHGNGRDWWILIPEFGNYKWHVFLLSPQGIEPIPIQITSIGGLLCEHHGATAMSPDGNKVANWGDCKLTIFDFDRCSGQLSAPLEVAAAPAHWFAGGGLAFSPNARFLYSTDHNVLYRTDLESSHPKMDTMRFSYGVGNYTVPGNTFHSLVNGPSDAIYGNIPSRAKYYHTLKSPDEISIDDINFVPQDISLPVTNVRTLPHFPNYRLYDLPDSDCDTLGINGPTSHIQDPLVLKRQKAIVRLFPNPANDILSIQTEMLALPAQAIIWDALGWQVLSQPLYAAATTLSIRQLPDGLYLVSVMDKTGRRVLRKLIVQQD